MSSHIKSSYGILVFSCYRVPMGRRTYVEVAPTDPGCILVLCCLTFLSVQTKISTLRKKNKQSMLQLKKFLHGQRKTKRRLCSALYVVLQHLKLKPLISILCRQHKYIEHLLSGIHRFYRILCILFTYSDSVWGSEGGPKSICNMASKQRQSKFSYYSNTASAATSKR